MCIYIYIYIYIICIYTCIYIISVCMSSYIDLYMFISVSIHKHAYTQITLKYIFKPI